MGNINSNDRVISSHDGPNKRSSEADNVWKENESKLHRTRQSLMNGDPQLTEAHEHIIALQDGIRVRQKTSFIEEEVNKRKPAIQQIVHMFQDQEKSLPTVSAYIPHVLCDAIFCGHLVTDLDSIAGAIGAAELYGGIPARASEVNSETRFALQYWGIPVPLPIEELVMSQPNAPICLVDHQQLSQVHPAINPDRVVGVIDHHALQGATLVTERPIYMDIRPWGSMSTIIAHTFLMTHKRPRKCVAGILLCAILSDTLNLLGPTTTSWDKMMVAILCEITGVEDINLLAQMQFKAKSKELGTLTATQLCNGDMKVFNYKTAGFDGCIGFAVIETTDDEVILARKEELIEELHKTREGKKVDILFLAVINIVALHSNLLLSRNIERSLALAAFPALNSDDAEIRERQKDDLSILYMGNRVSRKNDFVPPLSRAITKDGWVPPVTN